MRGLDDRLGSELSNPPGSFGYLLQVDLMKFPAWQGCAAVNAAKHLQTLQVDFPARLSRSSSDDMNRC